jgi:hypothetical protein
MVFYSTIQLMKEGLIVLALIISTITVVTVLGTILAFLDSNTISQLVYAQTNATSTNNMTVAKSGNITAPIVPQGTSINASNSTSP